MRFLCIDEAQRADGVYPETFDNADRSAKRSALSCLVTPVGALRAHVVLSGTGLGIESSFELLASGAAKHGVHPRLVGTTSTFNVDSLRAAVKTRGYAGQVDDDVLRLFSGRPRFGMRLAEALVLGKPVESAANDVSAGLGKVLQKLKVVPVGSPANAKTLYGEFRFAAMEWVLKGQGGVTQHGEVALEQGVCAISMRSSGSESTFVIEEPLVIRAFADLPDADFESVTNETDAHIGLMFEDYVAFHAEELCGLLDIRDLGKINDSFRGPWTLAKPAGDERRGERCVDGDEPTAIREMLEVALKGGKGLSLVFPGTAMGADLVIAARRPDGRILLLFVQVKACLKKSTPEALRSLRLPYHQNREKSPSVPAGSVPALQALNDEIFRSDVSVVFLVFKYPADSARAYNRFQTHEYTEFLEPLPSGSRSRRAKAKPRTKQCLEVVVDASNAQELLTMMKDGLNKMAGVKRLRRSAFLDS